MSLQPGTTLGPYEVLAAIGAGGMGEVYKARDTKLDRVNRGKRLGHTLSPVTIRRLWKGTAS